MRKFLLLFFFPLFFFCSAYGQKFTVVIDAGHGGKDPGAVSGTIKEKDINLAVAQLLGKYIEAKHSDTKVVYTRSTDVFVDLDKRANIANKAKANLFISIHVNSTAAKVEKKATGVETYILGMSRSAENLEVAKRENSVILLEDDYNKKYEGFDPKSPESYIIFEFMTFKYMDQSLDFANSIQEKVRSVAKQPNRGVKQAGFLVLRKSSMPSTLIELGFINNPTDAANMTSANGQRALASSIFAAFEDYKEDFQKKGGSVTPQKSVQEKKTNTNRSAINKKTKKNDSPESKIAPENNNQEEKQAQVQSTNDEKNIKNNVNDFIVKKTKQKPQNTDNDEINKAIEVKQQAENKKAETGRLPKTNGNTKITTAEERKREKKAIKADEIEYRVQFLGSSTEIPANSPKFKNLEPVSVYVDGGVYKYTYGSTNDYNEILKEQKIVKKKFADAFVVKFKNNTRIK